MKIAARRAQLHRDFNSANSVASDVEGLLGGKHSWTTYMILTHGI